MSDTRTQVRLLPVIRVFVSSTFSDMKHERNALEAEAFPKLEQLCQRHGFQFQAIDLRWGVSTEAGLDHRTMRICFDELRRAQELSPRPNFLILLGNRYGWRPLPEEISVDEFHTLEHAAAQIPGSADKSAVAVLREWYREDTNAVPPVYLLQSRRQDLGDGKDYTHDAVWNQVQAVLWTIINRAMPPEQLQQRFDGAAPDGPPPAIVRFQASATEQEIWHGALRVPDAREHVLAYFREIENLANFSDPKPINDFVDVDPSGGVEVALQTEQERLKAELRQRLGSANVLRNEAPVRLVETLDNEGGRTVDVTTDHLAQLCADVVSRLSEIIQSQIEEYWRNTAQASVDRAARELEIEQREYERFAKERGGEESFVGRQVELEAILDYVGSDSRWPLVIHGASGCGKTALLARASQEVAKTRKRIERFIGVAPRSSDLRSLLSSLCQDLRQRNPSADALPTEIKELRDEFSRHLQAATPEQPLILFLDALDQLGDTDNGRLLNWLPPGSLPAHVKLIVSCLSDRADGDPAGQPYSELKHQSRQIPAKNFVNLDVLSEAEARLLLFDRWLPKSGRKVSDEQRARIEQRLASPACRQPIYLKLLFEEVQLWHSYDPAPAPGESVRALLGQLFDRLCQPTNHGPLLVNRVLGYLSASRHGLAENELLEILFADPEYRAKLNEATEQTRHDLPPNAKRIPIALWSRLRFDLALYLTERVAPGANVLTYYHRQVEEWVQERYAKSSVQNWQPHQRLANYFYSLADPGKDQSWDGGNPRPFLQVVFHQIWADRADEYCQTLCDLRFLEARCRMAQVFELIADYQLAKEHLPEAQAELAEERWRQERAHGPEGELRQSTNLARYRDHLLRFARGEDLVFDPVLSKTPESPDGTGAGEVPTNPGRWIKAFRHFVGSHAHLLCRLQCRADLVLQLAFNSARGSPVSQAAERLMLASPGWRLLEPDHLRCEWNPTPGLICTIEAHAESVESLDFSADGRHLLSLGANRLTVWEIKHRDSLEAHPIALPPDVENILNARSSADAARVVVVEDSGLLLSTPDGTCERRIVTKEGGRHIAITADARWAATFSGRVFREWDLRAGTHRRSVATQSADIDAIAMSVDGRRIVTAHQDYIVRLHDLTRDAPPVSVSLVADPHQDLAMRFTRHARLLIAYTRDNRHFLDVLGHSGAWELSVPLGDDQVDGLAVTADGSRAFVGQHNGTVRCFDLSTGVCTRVFRTAYDRPQLVALRRRDSQLVVISSDGDDDATEIWTLTTGQCTRRTDTRDDSYWTAQALLPNGDTVVVTRSDQGKKILELRNLLDGRLVRTLGPWEQAKSEVVVPKHTPRILTGSWQHGIQEWSLDGRTASRSLGEEGHTVREFHSDAAGVVGLSSRTDTSLRVWNLRTQQCVREIPALSDWDAKVRVSPDGRLAASCEHEFVVRIWDRMPGGSRSEAARLTGHRGVIHGLAITPDGRAVVSGSWDTTMRAWDLATGTSRILRGHADHVDRVVASADGKLGLSWATDGTLRVWDLTTEREGKVLETKTEYIKSLSMTADGALVASGDEHGRIKLWDVAHGKLDQGHRRHNWFVYTACLLPGSTVVATSSADGTVGIWDLCARVRDTIVSASDAVRGPDPDKVQSIVPLANGFASAGQDGKIRLWDAKTRECCGILVPESYGKLWGCNQTHLAVVADQSFLVSANDIDANVHIWDVARRSRIKSISVHEGGVEAIALSADGRTLASFFSTTVREVLPTSINYKSGPTTMELWDLKDACCLRTTSVAAFVRTAHFTPRGDRVVVVGHEIEVWDPMCGERAWSTPGYLAAVSPTGEDVVVASEEALYRIDLSSGRVIREFRGHGARLVDLQVTPDGSWLVSAGDDRTIRVWSLDSAECVAMDVFESRPRALSRISAHGLFAYGTDAGEVLIRKMTGIEIGPCLATPVRLWIHGEQPHWDQRFVVRCPECAYLAPESDFSKTRAATCGKCGVMLQATPFVVDRS